MPVKNTDKGIVEVVVKRFEPERWPRAQAIKAKVDQGGGLDDIAFLDQALYQFD